MKFDILKGLKSLITSISGKKEQPHTAEKKKIHPVEKIKKGSIGRKKEDSVEKMEAYGTFLSL